MSQQHAQPSTTRNNIPASTSNRPSKRSRHRCPNRHSPVHPSVCATPTRTKTGRELTIHRTHQTTRSVPREPPSLVHVIQARQPNLSAQLIGRLFIQHILISVHNTGRLILRPRASPPTTSKPEFAHPPRDRNLGNFHIHERDQPNETVKAFNETLIYYPVNHKVDRLSRDFFDLVPRFFDIFNSRVELVTEVLNNFTKPVKQGFDVPVVNILHLRRHVIPPESDPPEDRFKNVVPQPFSCAHQGVPDGFQDAVPNPLHPVKDLLPFITNPGEYWLQHISPQPGGNRNDSFPHRFQHALPVQLHPQKDKLPLLANPREHRRQHVVPQPQRHGDNGIPHGFQNVFPGRFHQIRHDLPLRPNRGEHHKQHGSPQPLDNG